MRRMILAAVAALIPSLATADEGSAAWAWAGRSAAPAVTAEAAWAWAGVPQCECSGTKPDCPCLAANKPKPTPKVELKPTASAEELVAKCLKDGKPLVAFVNMDSRRIDGCVTYRAPVAEAGQKASYIAVMRPDGTRVDLGDCATDKEIVAATKVVAKQPAPVVVPVTFDFGQGCPGGNCRRQ